MAHAPLSLLASQPASTGGLLNATPGEVFWLVAGVALLPFLLAVVTSFAKLVIVGGLVRMALGTPRIPPAPVITGLAIVLTVHIMWPVGAAMLSEHRRLRDSAAAGAGVSPGAGTLNAAASVQPALHEFLLKHSHPRNVALFERLSERIRPAGGEPPESAVRAALGGQAATPDDPRLATAAQLAYDATVLAPAFLLSELTEAFQIGFLLFIPFFVIDLVVSNVLLSLGMHMLSPTTVSLPLKLLLFVLMDGWTLVMRGLVMNYT